MRSRLSRVSRHPHFRCSFGGDFSMWPCPCPCPCVPSHNSLPKSYATDVPLVATLCRCRRVLFLWFQKFSVPCWGAAGQRMRDTPLSLSRIITYWLDQSRSESSRISRAARRKRGVERGAPPPTITSSSEDRREWLSRGGATTITTGSGDFYLLYLPFPALFSSSSLSSRFLLLRP